MNQIYYIVGGILLGLLLLVLLKVYFNGGVCKIRKDLRGQVVFITGGNTGIGAETAVELGQMGATVVIACRDVQRAQEVANRITVGESRIFRLDLTDLNDVEHCVEQFKALRLDRIDILINNAGIMAPTEYKQTKQFFEIQFGVNHVAHFYLTHLLHPFLRRAQNPRIINVASTAHEMAKLDLNDLNFSSQGTNPSWGTRYTFTAYGNSKLCNILHAMVLQQRNQGIVSQFLIPSSLHPGVVRTNLLDTFVQSWWKKFIFCLIYPFWWLTTKSVLQGAQTTLFCALAENEELQTGAYYSDCALKAPKFATPELANALWEKTVELLREKGIEVVKQI